MARTAAAQVNARKETFDCRRMVMITAALIVALAQFAGVHQAAAQYPPMGPPRQAPYPTYAPYPGQMEPPGMRGMGRTDAQHYVGRQHRNRREFVARKRTFVERKRASRPAKTVENRRKIAESNGYKRVSDLVNFPKFFPGLGVVFVKPDTLPTGPFLCFDRKDRLIATVYMFPVKDIDDHKTTEAAGVAGPLDHVSFYFNPGHPGVDTPHYHFVIWHVSKKDEARVAQ